MLDYDLIKNILIVSIGAGVITTALVQKIKTYLGSSKYIPVVSFFVSLVIGTLFALCFSNASLIDALWTGLFAFIGADAIYKAFEGRVFNSFGTIKESKEDLETIIKVEGAEEE